MRHLLRLTLNLAAAVSAVLFVAVVAIWVRSYWVSDEFRWARLVDDPTRIRSITHDWGRIIIVGTVVDAQEC